MKFIYKMEFVLIALISILCSILLFKLIYKLRSVLPWRANCWFCNTNIWLKFSERNSWTCPKCDQYNGFTKDGDYNKPIFASNDQAHKSTKVFQRSPPKNGLCKMCNINQQLKVAQLANFVPMNEKNFEEEIESYRMQLEKAYKLCSPCKKVLQIKLHKEKETLLGSKLLETRTPEKKHHKHDTQNVKLKSFINNISIVMAMILLVLVSIDFYKKSTTKHTTNSTITNIKEIATGLIERIFSIVKMKIKMTFPILEDYFIYFSNIFDMDLLPQILPFGLKSLDKTNIIIQKVMGGFVCLIQIIGLIWNVNKMKHTLVIDLLWSVFVITSIAEHSVAIDPIVMSLVKLLSIMSVLVTYRSIKTKAMKPAPRVPTTPRRMKNMSRSMNSVMDSEESLSMDTDDDVSLSKYGLSHFSDSNETISPVNNSLINARSFTPRSNFNTSSDSLWTKPKHNSVFCVNTALKSPSSVSDTVFIKPTFSKYQNLAKSDSDSDLDESISSLCIGSPSKSKKRSESIFSLRKFTATPSFVAPRPRARPLISPSKLAPGASWVAGGYWGLEERGPSLAGSRSSSQSSGFESQASSVTRNVFSREPSVCGEPDRSTLLDRFQNCHMGGYGNVQTPQNFSQMSSPVFPQMQFNGHVHIPQPRFARNVPPGVFAHQPYVQTDMFKAPGGSGLIKLPQVNSFSR